MSTAVETYTLNNEWMLMTAPQDAYSWHFKQFEKWMQEGGRELNYSSLLGYFRKLDSSGLAANTIRISRQSVKNRIRLLMRSADVQTRVTMNQALEDLDHDVPPPKVNSCAVTRDMCLTVQEVKELVKKARSRKQKAFIRFLFNTGARISELTGVKIGHCTRENGKVKIRLLGKGKKERYVQVTEALFDFVQETFRGEQFLFETEGGKPYHRCYVSNQIKKLGRHVLNKNISAHTMRHSRISSWVQGHPGSLDAISKYCGHSNVSITLSMYCHSEMSEEMLFEEEL